MTDPVTHMCWSEQISPLAYSSQATWQPFNLSHCIEIRNTHPLSRAGQLSQTYFTHSAPILAPRNQPPTVNKQWPPLRESRMSCHTHFNPAVKTETGTNTVHRSIRPLTRFRFCISIVSKMSESELFEIQFGNLSPRSLCDFGETGRACATTFLLPVKSRHGLVDFYTKTIVCCLTQRVIWQFCCIIIKI